jgi:hypothetical protein
MMARSLNDERLVVLPPSEWREMLEAYVRDEIGLRVQFSHYERRSQQMVMLVVGDGDP